MKNIKFKLFINIGDHYNLYIKTYKYIIKRQYV